MSPGDIAAAFAPHLGLSPGALSFLRYSQNYVFTYREDGAERILRITSDEHRNRVEIAAELEWIRHLHRAGAAVCAPAGNCADIVTAACEGTVFHGVTFEKAPGRPVAREDLSADLFRAHGRTLGTFHRLAAGFLPAWAAARRPWDEERYFDRDISDYLPAQHRAPLRDIFARLQSEVNSAPRTDRTFGPVHFDLGYSNFFVDAGRLSVFDFDNCTVGHFLGDIAAALYGSVFTLVRCEFPGDRSAFEPPKSSRNLEEVFAPFREGYASAFEWPDDAPDRLQSWLDLMYFRSVIHAWRLQSPITNPKVQAALDADIENLLAGTTPISISRSD